MAIFVFLSGTSQVGKTELYDNFPDVTQYKLSGQKFNTKRIEMNVTNIRKGFGNPSWSSLQDDAELAEKHQRGIINIYADRIKKAYDEAKIDDLFLFERTPIDVAGYSYSFGIDPRPYLLEHLDMVNYIGKNHTLYFIHLVPNPAYVYNRRDNTRPPFSVRMACGDYIEKHLGTRLRTSQATVQQTLDWLGLMPVE